MNTFLTIFAAMTVSLNAMAANTKTKAIPGRHLKLDTEASTMNWTGKKLTGTHTGTLKFKEGSFDIKGGNIKGSLVIDLTSLEVTDLKDDKKGDLEGHLKSEDFFNVAKFPTATYKIKSATAENNLNPNIKSMTFVGDLTVMGITKPEKISVMFEEKEDGMEMTGKATIDRTKYGIKYKSKKFFGSLGDKAINDEFDIEFKVIAKP